MIDSYKIFTNNFALSIIGSFPNQSRQTKGIINDFISEFAQPHYTQRCNAPRRMFANTRTGETCLEFQRKLGTVETLRASVPGGRIGFELYTASRVADEGWNSWTIKRFSKLWFLDRNPRWFGGTFEDLEPRKQFEIVNASVTI
ncbi:hypothetical protein J6590_009117 [Homalodisca vitripennis]|nr:hypothetical protein J6590_009117 [Homalodisca vitripennis]